MTVRRSLAFAGVLFAAAITPASAQRPSSVIPVQAAVGVEPDTVRIGDPFVVQVGIRAPRGATIEFAPAPDSTGAVQALDPIRFETRPDSGGVVQWAYYRVAAWFLGEQPIPLGDAIVRLGGQVRRVPLAGRHVFVASVLPADTALRIPKPARPLAEYGLSLWWLVALLAALALLLLLLWWWWRRRRRGRPAIVVDPFAHAEREFIRIEALRLVDAGERGRHVTLMLEVARDYLAARHGAAQLALTSSELLAALRGQRTVPHDRLGRVLGEADLIKFARRPVTPERARELGKELRSIVAQEHAASVAPAEQEKAA
jgi:hypothetical protein